MLEGLGAADGRLRRSWKDGRATADGGLEDYADLAEGLLALYEATFDERWFASAVSLVEVILARFPDPRGGFFDTPDDGERARRAHEGRPGQRDALGRGDGRDRPAPARGAHRGGPLRGGRGVGAGERSALRSSAIRRPSPSGCVPSSSSTPASTEVAIVGDRDDPVVRRLIATVDRGYHPFRVLACSASPDASAVPLLRGRFALRGRPTAFVCRQFACRQPVHEPEALDALLVEALSPR